MKGFKKALKNFTHQYMDGMGCVCLSVCLSVLQKKLSSFWWNKEILMKIPGLVQLCTNKFWVGRGCQISWPQGLGWKQPVSGKSIPSMSFYPTGVWYSFLKTLKLGLKSLGSRMLNYGVGHEISGSKWADTCQKFISPFGIWHFHIK